jgi:hypothetical protein
MKKMLAWMLLAAETLFVASLLVVYLSDLKSQWLYHRDPVQRSALVLFSLGVILLFVFWLMSIPKLARGLSELGSSAPATGIDAGMK